MSSASDKTFIRARAIPAALRFTDWPLRNEPRRSGTLILLVIAASWICGAVADDTRIGFLILALLAVSLRRLWLPRVYEISSKGLVLSVFGRKRRIPWNEIARVEVHDDGLFLGYDSERHSLSFLRGLFIGWNGHRDEMLNVVDFYLQPPVSGSHPTTRTLSQS